MNRSLEWRLARTFVRCYALVLLMTFVQTVIGPILGLVLSESVSTRDWERSHSLQDLGPPIVTITTLLVWLAVTATLWLYSGRIADRLAGTHESAVEGETLDFPFDLGVGLAGLIFMVEGLQSISREFAYWYTSKSEVFPYQRAGGLVSSRFVAYSVGAILGLVLFVGARPIVDAIGRLRGMPLPTDETGVV